jgi:hypothetical protein
MLDGIIERHGSVADYLRANGLRDDELADLRRLLIID